jgi:hypothetical protein
VYNHEIIIFFRIPIFLEIILALMNVNCVSHCTIMKAVILFTPKEKNIKSTCAEEPRKVVIDNLRAYNIVNTNFYLLKEAKDAIPLPQLSQPRVQFKKFAKIGRPGIFFINIYDNTSTIYFLLKGYKVIKEKNPVTQQHALLFQVLLLYNHF